MGVTGAKVTFHSWTDWRKNAQGLRGLLAKDTGDFSRRLAVQYPSACFCFVILECPWYFLHAGYGNPESPVLGEGQYRRQRE
jgi:hypothetical protein